MMRCHMLPYYFFLLVSTVLGADHPHRVKNLPGAPSEPSFPLYSGFIHVDIDDSRHSIFYVLCESIRADPLESPLVVWLNGGPGASSLIGFATGNGPYFLDGDSGQLRYNDLSWNQYSNVLYIESPDGVGFSTSNRTTARYNDDSTANLTMKVLHEFMTRVHPRYASREFFIAGESYAGVYIPYLTRAIFTGLQEGTFTNKHFRGIAVGNAQIDSYSLSLSSAIQMYSMGMIAQKHGPILFNLWRNITDGDTTKKMFWSLALHSEFHIKLLALNKSAYNLHLSCETELDAKVWHVPLLIKNADECAILKNVETYFNRENVQKSINVITNNGEKVQWSAAGADYIIDAYDVSRDTVPLYSQIFDMIQEDFRILFYTGDLDLACPAIHVDRGTRLIATKNEMKEIESAKYTPKIWTYLGDFGGAQTSYKSTNKNITMDVLTVRGAGHFVSVNHPSRSFQIINNFLFSNNNKIDYSAKIRRRKNFAHNSFEQEAEGSGFEGSGLSPELISME